MRILHLAYEDPLQPGSGGGSVRAREINRRLASRHEITALVAGYPSAKPRTEDGVRWVPIGPRTGRKVDRLAYFPLLAREVLRRPHDLVVEEFGAPFSVGFSPLYTNKPVVASVQWMFAAQMREKYGGLPFDWVERGGLRFYERFIAVSGWLEQVILSKRPQATVETIPNGVEKIAYEAKTTEPGHLLFVGRLDIQKGVDLLFGVMGRLRRMRGGDVPPLVVVGDGPDREILQKLAKQSRLSDLVEFRGRLEGADKYRLMANAHAVLMPSRHETFGMVAVECLAAGAPLVAFDVGPLREVVGDGSGARLVPPFDLDAFAEETARFLDDGKLREQFREAGRSWARRYDWEEIAQQQEEFYLRVAEEHKTRSGRRKSKGG